MIYESEVLGKLFTRIVEETEKACERTNGIYIFWEDIWDSNAFEIITLEKEAITPRKAIDTFLALIDKYNRLTYFYTKEMNAYVIIPGEFHKAEPLFETEVRKISTESIKAGISNTELEKKRLEEEKEVLENQIRELDKKLKKE